MAAHKRTPESWLSQTQAELYEDTEYLTIPPVGVMLESALPLPPPDTIKVLDLGCGMGQVASQLIKHPKYKGADLLNIDADESMVAAVRAKGLSAEQVDILTMSYEEKFTHVFADFVFFLLSNPSEGLARAAKALVPGGYLAFTTWAKSGPFLLLQEAFSLLPVPPLPNMPPTWNDNKYVLDQLSRVPLESVTSERISFKHNTVNRSLHDLAWDMRPVVAMIVRRWPAELQREYGWASFGKIEEVLGKWESDGKELESEVWVFTARKKAH